VVRLSGKPASAEDVKREIKEAVAAAKSYSFNQKDQYEKRLRSVARDLDERIDDLQERASEARGEARAEVEKELKELKKKRVVLREKLAKVRSASADAWGTSSRA
jgi:cell division protein ZapA (FtsZ GTPase activity inhibitor)